jgi:hypothetical protein
VATRSTCHVRSACTHEREGLQRRVNPRGSKAFKSRVVTVVPPFTEALLAQGPLAHKAPLRGHRKERSGAHNVYSPFLLIEHLRRAEAAESGVRVWCTS